MLGFVISTIAFSWAFSHLNRHSNVRSFGNTRSRRVLVMSIATAFSIGVGWIVDKVDGDADLPHPSVSEVIQSGDPLQVIKMLAGMN